jgi:hypothetical protein
MVSNHTKPPYTPVWPGPALRRAGASGLPAELPGRFSGGARPTRLSLHEHLDGYSMRGIQRYARAVQSKWFAKFAKARSTAAAAQLRKCGR